jgi:ketol-acid reductoisomerase
MTVALDSGLTVRVLVREGESAIEVWNAEKKGWKSGDPELLAKVPRWVLMLLGVPVTN